jgi:hypothetical protein
MLDFDVHKPGLTVPYLFAGVEAVAELEVVTAAEAVAAAEVPLAVRHELIVVPEHNICSRKQMKPKI